MPWLGRIASTTSRRRRADARRPARSGRCASSRWHRGRARARLRRRPRRPPPSFPTSAMDSNAHGSRPRARERRRNVSARGLRDVFAIATNGPTPGRPDVSAFSLSSEPKLQVARGSTKIIDHVSLASSLGKGRRTGIVRPWPRPPICATLALADAFREQIARGAVNAAGIARLHGLNARVSQILALHRLAPVIVTFLRALPAGPHERFYTERRVRPLLAMPHARQCRAARTLLPGFTG